MTRSQRWFAVLAGLLGALGVAAAAGATHTGSPLLGPLSTISLVHAPAFLAVAFLAPEKRRWLIVSLLLAAGVVLFCLDLLVRQFWGQSPLGLLAPLGGLLMIVGWLGIAGVAVTER